ncbi:MAG: hypothetical protein AVO34_02655 [Firmicutes bacterium ML8_F2]|nr:MAG: hypothetical protein AVO34_02655 [Firmicutes bacterium ML8_F2]
MLRKIIGPLVIMLIAMLAIGAGGYYLEEGFQTTGAGSYTPVFELSPEEDESTGQDESAKTYETPAYKDETVYVLLDHDGSVLEQQIVNRLYGQHDPEAPLVADYGTYLSVENMTSSAEPVIEENRLLWKSELLKIDELYYEGTLDKELPVDINISYYLDGEPVAPSSLGGQGGRLEIVIQAENNLLYDGTVSYHDHEGTLVTVEEENYVPLLVQGTMDVDLNRFSNIDTGEGLDIVIGQSASINFMIFPYPEAEIKISMDGDDIELGSISFIVTPQLPPMNEIDIEDELVEMLEGFSMLSGGLAELEGGADLLLQGMRRFEQESDQMTGMTAEWSALIDEYSKQKSTYDKLITDFAAGDLTEVVSSMQDLLGEIENLPDPGTITDDIAIAADSSAELKNHIAVLNNSLAAAEDTDTRIRSEAERLVAENEPGTGLHELGMLILSREKTLDTTFAERQIIDRNIGELDDALQSLERFWQEDYLPEVAFLEELSSVTDNEWYEAGKYLEFVAVELDSFADYYREIDDVILEAEGMLGDISRLPGALKELTYGQTRLTEGLKELRESGIMAMEKGLIEGVNEAKYGAAKLELMEKLADDYRSYADNVHNRHSKVQFIMQTEKITAPAEEDPEEEKEDTLPEPEYFWAIEFWNKMIHLFDFQ